MSETSGYTVRFAGLERRGLILGLSAAQTAVLGVGLIVAVLAEYLASAAGIAATAPIWGLPAVVALVWVRGRPMLEWLPVVAHWGARRVLGVTGHRTPPRGDEHAQLVAPGVPRHLGVVTGPSTGAALVHDPRAGTLTGVLAVSGRGFWLADPGTRDHRVAGWDRLLASLCQQPAIVRLQVLQRAVPGGAAPVRRWWAEHALAGAPWAARVVADLLAAAAQSSTRHECLLAVAVRTARGGRRGPTPAAVALTEQQLAAVAAAAENAELDVAGWATPDRLDHALRTSYDPDPPGTRDGTGSGRSPLVAAMAVEEEWASIRTDSAHHAVYWVREWPRSDAHPGFLQPLLLAPGARRTLSLIAEPQPTSRALRDIRRAKAEHLADAAHRARVGQIEDEATRAEAADLLRREQDLVAGHGDLRFVGLLTVSAATGEDLAAACAATESAAAQAMCQLRRLVGQQGQAFGAGAVPLARAVW